MNELSHHGIQGQKWGVRHGPPYPIDRDKGDITIKKGTHFGRYSLSQEHSAKGHAYVNYLNSDVERYKGFFGARLIGQSRGKDTVYKIDLEAKEDMKAPSKEKRIKTFLEMYNDKHFDLAGELGSYHKSDFHSFTPLKESFYKKQYSQLSKDEQLTKGYETFVRSLGGNKTIRDEYFKRLSKQGYSFVTDDLDGGRFGKEPAIIFDRYLSTNYGGSQEITKKEIMNTWKREGTRLKE